MAKLKDPDANECIVDGKLVLPASEGWANARKGLASIKANGSDAFLQECQPSMDSLDHRLSKVVAALSGAANSIFGTHVCSCVDTLTSLLQPGDSAPDEVKAHAEILKMKGGLVNLEDFDAVATPSQQKAFQADQDQQGQSIGCLAKGSGLLITLLSRPTPSANETPETTRLDLCTLEQDVFIGLDTIRHCGGSATTLRTRVLKVWAVLVDYYGGSRVSGYALFCIRSLFSQIRFCPMGS